MHTLVVDVCVDLIGFWRLIRRPCLSGTAAVVMDSRAAVSTLVLCRLSADVTSETAAGLAIYHHGDGSCLQRMPPHRINRQAVSTSFTQAVRTIRRAEMRVGIQTGHHAASTAAPPDR